MPKLNLVKIRNANNRVMKSYERYGTKLFLDTLKAQAVNWNPDLMVRAYQDFYAKVFVDSAKREFNRIRMQEKNFIPNDFFLSTWTAWIRNWVLDNLGQLIANVNDNTRKQIQVTLGEAIEQGLNPFQTEKLLREQVGSKSRALAIARTEGTRANNMGKERSAQDWANETGENLFKVWIWGGSKEPRDEHIALQNRPIPMSDFFIGVDGLPMTKPGDLSGGPQNTINCSCTVVYVSERYARRNYPDSF